MIKKFALLAASACVSLSLLIGASVTSFATPPMGYQMFKIGDINNDGKIDAGDYTLQQQAILNLTNLTPNQKVAADVNGDDAITPTDHTILGNYLLGVPGNYAIGTYYSVVYGDAELDGDLDQQDINFVQGIVNGTNGASYKQYAAADANKDGVVTQADVSYMNLYIH